MLSASAISAFYCIDINDHSVEIAEIYSNLSSQKLRETNTFIRGVNKRFKLKEDPQTKNGINT